jgi:hypothetical protein
MKTFPYGWILTERIDVCAIPEEEIVLVTNRATRQGHSVVGKTRLAILSTTHDGVVRINSKFWDVGDLAPQFLGIMDAAVEADGWIELWPGDDDPGNDGEICPKDGRRH